MFKHLRYVCHMTVAAMVIIMGGVAQADMASPHVIHSVQPDGTKIALHIRGSHALHWQEDLNGYTVVRDRGNSGRYVYAKRGHSGHLLPTAHEVGKANPKALGLQHRVLPSAAVRALRRADGPAGQTSEETSIGQPYLESGPQTLRNLVVLVRFSDHTGRTLPSESNIDVLMNAVGGDPALAPAGSLRDIYLNNSYGALTLDSTVVAWATVSNTEAYYADGNSGLTTLIHQALGEALDIVDSSVDFTTFDQDGDGYIDAITFLHSGYGAEWGDTDAYGGYYTDRIWSHKWALYSLPGASWVSDEGVEVYNYHISPSLWGTSGSTIGRIGVIAHETGHFLGLPDLYDTDSSPGSGIGSWGLMANSWGGDGSQQPPPLMSAWSKIALGWLDPNDLFAPGHYTLGDSLNSNQVYKVTDSFPADEYLLIENRRRKNTSNAVVDNIPASGDGLVIYHIDDSTSYNTEGYPGQPGWPQNGNHYRVAVLQADGNYNLERGNNRGDSGDAYRENFVSLIGPATTPSTNSYQDGAVYATDHEISAISAAGATMEFDFNAGQIPAEPPAAPSSLTATTTGHYSIDVMWVDNSSNEEGFSLERKESGDTNWTVVTDLGPNTTSFSDSGLIEGTAYEYQVKAYNSAGDSIYSNTGTATTTIPTPPTAPTGLTATAVSENQIDLAWTNGDNATGLEVQRSVDSMSFATITTLDPAETSYLDSGLSPSTSYTYRVMAFNSDGSATSEIASATTNASSPMAYATGENPVHGMQEGSFEDTWGSGGTVEEITEDLSSSKKNGRSQLEHVWQIGPVVGGDQVILTVAAWANSAVEDFTFSYSIDGGASYTDVLTVDDTTTITQTVELPPETSGTLYLRVQDSDRSRGETILDTVSIDYIVVESWGEIVLTAPTNLTGSAVSSSEIALNWDDASGETGYTVEYRENGTADWLVAISDLAANSIDYVVTGLAPSTAYDFQVCAFDDSSQSMCETTYSPITTLEDGVQQEVVTITLAQYKTKAKQLQVKAISSLQPQAVLTLVGYGEMTYSAADGLYIYQAKAGDPGNTVTVTSDLDGSAIAPVDHK
jgi:M6 family metalloprotease-like protein